MATRKLKDRGEKRLYVVVAGTVQPLGGPSVTQPYGRQSAQAGHAVGLFRWRQGKSGEPYSDITTIHLQCRDNAEMNHVIRLLVRKKINVHPFVDTNPEYGETKQVMTAFCTEPVYKDQVEGILDYLPKLGCGGPNDSKAIKRSDVDRSR